MSRHVQRRTTTHTERRHAHTHGTVYSGRRTKDKTLSLPLSFHRWVVVVVVIESGRSVVPFFVVVTVAVLIVNWPLFVRLWPLRHCDTTTTSQQGERTNERTNERTTTHQPANELAAESGEQRNHEFLIIDIFTTPITATIIHILLKDLLDSGYTRRRVLLVIVVFLIKEDAAITAKRVTASIYNREYTARNPRVGRGSQPASQPARESTNRTVQYSATHSAAKQKRINQNSRDCGSHTSIPSPAVP